HTETRRSAKDFRTTPILVMLREGAASSQHRAAATVPPEAGLLDRIDGDFLLDAAPSRSMTAVIFSCTILRCANPCATGEENDRKRN
ncbi:MAG TPA: hypothetical protein VF835_07265, partial [Rhizomicrobium sp.]